MVAYLQLLFFICTFASLKQLKLTEMNTFKDFTALVPMGGQYEGKIARHSYRGESLEAAQQWAKYRFSNPESAVIILDSDYPWLYENVSNYTDENDPLYIEDCRKTKELYNKLKK